MNERFEELLPWYAHGTLGAEDRAWVDAYLEQNPQARGELDWHASLQVRVRENAPTVPPTIGLARAMRLIQGDRPTWSERIGAFFGNFGMNLAAFGWTEANKPGRLALSDAMQKSVAAFVRTAEAAGLRAVPPR